MTKKLLRYVGPIAFAIGFTSGVLGAGAAGASTANGKAHHGHHANHVAHKATHQHKKTG